MLVIITLVSSAKSTGVEIAFTALGRSLIYIRNSKGPRTDPCYVVIKCKEN
jgi:hypothetical protein